LTVKKLQSSPLVLLVQDFMSAREVEYVLYSLYTVLYCTHYTLYCTVLTIHCAVLYSLYSLYCTVLTI
jgi:hypothetical protein